MNEHLTDTNPPSGSGPWRLLILDRDPDDPRYLIATVGVSNVRPARLVNGRPRDLPAAIEWAEHVCGQAVELSPLISPSGWLIRERSPR